MNFPASTKPHETIPLKLYVTQPITTFSRTLTKSEGSYSCSHESATGSYNVNEDVWENGVIAPPSLTSARDSEPDECSPCFPSLCGNYDEIELINWNTRSTVSPMQSNIHLCIHFGKLGEK
jgi:hypothetical protein